MSSLDVASAPTQVGGRTGASVLATPSDWRTRLQRRVVVPWMRPYAPSAGRAAFALGELRQFLFGTILDVGAGANQFIFKAALGDAYRALDIEVSYKLDAANAAKGFHAVADLEHAPLPFEDRSFDTVVCMDALEHLDNIYAVYDELFRVSRRYVIVSLPNNWPGMIASLLIGRNVTHRAGYGLPPEPKADGQRHKHFFNLEEACDFLVGRASPGFTLRRLDLRFEPGTDGLMFALPGANLLRKAQAGSRRTAVSRHGKVAGSALWLAARAAYLTVRIPDTLAAACLWGWGNPVRFYNLFCRQIWVVFERSPQ